MSDPSGRLDTLRITGLRRNTVLLEENEVIVGVKAKMYHVSQTAYMKSNSKLQAEV
jgi:hypothetical protein